mmetsp:Transcript_8606/g.18377  ORF Transcript_8606/g.18377 Transcript_8606/m.18377 type:complete len:188 (+) Transcript_8606:1919-2482(+)
MYTSTPFSSIFARMAASFSPAGILDAADLTKSIVDSSSVGTLLKCLVKILFPPNFDLKPKAPPRVFAITDEKLGDLSLLAPKLRKEDAPEDDEISKIIALAAAPAPPTVVREKALAEAADATKTRQQGTRASALLVARRECECRDETSAAAAVVAAAVIIVGVRWLMIFFCARYKGYENVRNGPQFF